MIWRGRKYVLRDFRGSRDRRGFRWVWFGLVVLVLLLLRQDSGCLDDKIFRRGVRGEDYGLLLGVEFSTTIMHSARHESKIARIPHSSNLSTSSWPGSEAMMSDSNRTEQRDSIRTQRLRPRARVASPSWSFVKRATRRAKVQGSTPDDDCRYEYSSQMSRMLFVRYSIDHGKGTV